MVLAERRGSSAVVGDAALLRFHRRLQGELILSDHPDYEDARKVHNHRDDRYPAVIVRVAEARHDASADVDAAARTQRQRHVAGKAAQQGAEAVDGAFADRVAALQRGLHHFTGRARGRRGRRRSLGELTVVWPVKSPAMATFPG